MRLRYTGTAASELRDILAYISERNPSAARAFAQRLERSTQVLVDFPEFAQMTDERGVRRLPIGRYPFLIFYTIEYDEIVILHVRYAARVAPWEER